MLILKEVSKKFGSLIAVNKVSLSIKPGEILSIIGPNGSGKTTMIKMIAGLLQPTVGSIMVGKNDAVRQPLEAKQQIGYIPDEPAIWSSMTGIEFLHFTGALYGMSTRARQKEIPRLLNIFGLKGIEQGYFEDYSRGNKQKFSILAALLHQPQLLLVDEPIVGLDPTSADIAKKLFQDFAAQGGSVLLATHTLPVAQEISGRIGILRKGVLVAIGGFSSLRKRARLADSASLRDVYSKLAQ